MKMSFGLLPFLVLAGCARLGEAPQRHGLGELPTSGLSMLFAPGEELLGNPNIYEVIVTPIGKAPIARAGDIPGPNQLVTIDRLPAAATATVTAGLYKDKLNWDAKTHTCKADAELTLVAGETASLALSCLPIANAEGLSPVQVFVKVAKASLDLTQGSVDAALGVRDWKQPSLFAFNDAKGRRISMKQDAAGLTLHVGGEVTYYLGTDASKTKNPVELLISGETLTLQAAAGRLLEAAPEDATLSLSSRPLLWEEQDGQMKVMMPLKLANATGTITAEGRLLEEPADAEFTVMSYNVENLFDQKDDERNKGYGDYRIAPNAAGQFSNWGQPVEFKGRTMSWTEAKSLTIRDTVTAAVPNGPEILGLIEVESAEALSVLFESVKDLGYVSQQFSQWAPDMGETAIGMAVIAKFPIASWSVLKVATPPGTNPEPSRPILKVTLTVRGMPLTVYVNHWKSKGGPESHRKLYAEALEADIAATLVTTPKYDYIVLGDLNSEYNEKVIIEAEHNDTDRTTGINDVLHAQGDETAVAKNQPGLKYNLHYELDRAARATAWYPQFGWNSLDHMIIGSGLYDRTGASYVDNSFQATNAKMLGVGALFQANGGTNRWKQVRVNKETRHELGGRADHLPIFARFLVMPRQSPAPIPMLDPSRPDASDTILATPAP